MGKTSLRYAALSVLIASIITPAHAYLDPGTGSAIVTAILGFFAAIAFTVRKYYYRIMSVFRGKSGQRKAPNQSEAGPAE